MELLCVRIYVQIPKRFISQETKGSVRSSVRKRLSVSMISERSTKGRFSVFV